MERISAWVMNKDRRVLQFMNLRLRCAFLDRWMNLLTHLGGAVCTIIVALLFLLRPENRFEAIIALAASHSLVHVLKKSFSRKRPYESEKNIQMTTNPLQDYSFPSGHTTAVFSVSMTWSFSIPWIAFLLLPVALLVAFSRIYLAHHYPTDVAIGGLIGILFAYGSHLFI